MNDGWTKERWENMLSRPYSRTVNKDKLSNATTEKLEFDFYEWQVPLIQDADVLEYFMESLNLKSRVIKSIKALGRCYNFGGEDFEDITNINYDSEFTAFVEIDEPLIIEFADGDNLEIDFSEASSLKMGLNTLPDNITYGTNKDNIDVDLVFKRCLNQKITGYTVFKNDKLTSTFTYSSGIPMPKGNFIEKLELYVGDNLKLVFEPYYDYGEVVLKDNEDNILIVKWKDIKEGLKA